MPANFQRLYTGKNWLTFYPSIYSYCLENSQLPSLNRLQRATVSKKEKLWLRPPGNENAKQTKKRSGTVEIFARLRLRCQVFLCSPGWLWHSHSHLQGYFVQVQIQSAVITQKLKKNQGSSVHRHEFYLKPIEDFMKQK